ncbi:MAG TPA: D-2-hydroxyacid dehydrogenase [Planctomycetota bacterium]
MASSASILVRFAAAVLLVAAAAAPLSAARAQEAIGSERGSVVALPVDPSLPLPRLVYVSPPLSAADLAACRAAAPNVEMHIARTQAEALRHAGEAHAADARFASAAFLEAAPKLRWVQAGSAGVERYLAVGELRSSEQVVLTNMKGMHGPAIADHAFAMLLMLTRDMRAYDAAQQAGRWDRGAAEAPIALHGRTMLVVGLGGIGSEIARRAHGFGMKVVATARTERPPPAYVDRLELAGALDGLLPQADVVAIAVPLTAETEGLFGAKQFALMKEGSYLINIARGRVCETDALVAALQSGRLAGACLDVTDPEPLPAGHPLWKAPNLVLTPHVSSFAQATEERTHALQIENLRRFARGLPLLNVVDKQAGY